MTLAFRWLPADFLPAAVPEEPAPKKLTASQRRRVAILAEVNASAPSPISRRSPLLYIVTPVTVLLGSLLDQHFQQKRTSWPSEHRAACLAVYRAHFAAAMGVDARTLRRRVDGKGWGFEDLEIVAPLLGMTLPELLRALADHLEGKE